MPFDAILDEVEQLQSVSTRLEGLAEEHPPVSQALITIAGSVRNTATVLAVLVATRSHADLSTQKIWADPDRRRADHGGDASEWARTTP